MSSTQETAYISIYRRYCREEVLAANIGISQGMTLRIAVVREVRRELSISPRPLLCMDQETDVLRSVRWRMTL